MSTPLEDARAAINALTPDELEQIQREASRLIKSYNELGGVLSGTGWLEVKEIAYPVKVFDEDGNVIDIEKRTEFYAYLRRLEITDKGRVRRVNVGYYGKAGVSAINEGYAEELLRIHNEGGQDAGDAFLSELYEQGIIEHEPPTRRGIGTKPPASSPTHPLNDERITPEALEADVIYKYFLTHAPVQAEALKQAINEYTDEHARYENAEAHGLRYRLPLAERQARRKRERRKRSPQPARRVPAKRRNDEHEA